MSRLLPEEQRLAFERYAAVALHALISSTPKPHNHNMLAEEAVLYADSMVASTSEWISWEEQQIQKELEADAEASRGQV